MAAKPTERKVTLTFTTRGPQRHFEDMLYNMINRAVVHGRIVCKIDGVRQDWWDQAQKDRERRLLARKRALERDQEERMFLHNEVKTEVDRDPSRSDEEIAEVLMHRADAPGSPLSFASRMSILGWTYWIDEARHGFGRGGALAEISSKASVGIRHQ